MAGFRVSWSHSGGTGESEDPVAGRLRRAPTSDLVRRRGGACRRPGQVGHLGLRLTCLQQPLQEAGTQCVRSLASRKLPLSREHWVPRKLTARGGVRLCSLLKASSAVAVNPEHLGVSGLLGLPAGKACAPAPSLAESVNLPDLCCEGRFPPGGFDRRGSWPHAPLPPRASQPEALCRVIPAWPPGTELALSRGGPLWWSWKAAG